MLQLKLIFIGLLMISALEAKPNFSMVFQKISCKNNASDYVESFKCFVKNPGDGNRIYAHLYTKKPAKYYEIRMQLYFERRKVAPWKTFDQTINGCTMFDPKKNTIFPMVIEEYRKYLNELLTCPFKGKFNYTLNGMSPLKFEVPGTMPEINSRNVMDIVIDRDPTQTLSIVVHINNRRTV